MVGSLFGCCPLEKNWAEPSYSRAPFPVQQYSYTVRDWFQAGFIQMYFACPYHPSTSTAKLLNIPLPLNLPYSTMSFTERSAVLQSAVDTYDFSDVYHKGDVSKYGPFDFIYRFFPSVRQNIQPSLEAKFFIPTYSVYENNGCCNCG